jgi:hypothetical protein
MSVLYCGKLERYRILSVNQKIQYLFFSGPRQVWIIPPQATTTELSSFGVRTIDVVVDEELCTPGFEYHFYDRSEDPPFLCSQIPPGFAGPAAPTDPDRADASLWLDRLPVIRPSDVRCWAAGRVARRRAAERARAATDLAARPSESGQDRSTKCGQPKTSPRTR